MQLLVACMFDGFALFFKIFLIATALVLLMSSEYTKTFAMESGNMSLSLFALSGMMFTSANHFALLFVSLELITITFYILTSFQRHQTILWRRGSNT